MLLGRKVLWKKIRVFSAADTHLFPLIYFSSHHHKNLLFAPKSPQPWQSCTCIPWRFYPGKKPFHLPHEIMKGTWCSFSSSCSGFVASQSLMGSDRALVGRSGSGRADTLQLLHFKALLLQALTGTDFKLQLWSHPE